jgi:hypothetical protein
MNTHVVTRSFEGPGGKQFKVGEAVDASGWAHTAKLVDQRRLRALTVNDDPVTGKHKGNRIQQAAQAAKEA